MASESPLTRLDLLVVGGIAVDRFEDGRSAPGGAVLHAAAAAHDAGRQVGAITAAGFEPEAEAGLSRLAGLRSLEVQRVARSIGYEHHQLASGRQLRFLGSAGTVITLDTAPASAAVLLAPVAAELDAAAAGRTVGEIRAAILQGWLRRLVPGEAVAPLPLAALDAALRDVLRGYDLLIASTEDLVAEAREATGQLDAMRREFGPRPALVLTDGTGGTWVDAGRGGTLERWKVPVSRVVDGVETVGAGDMLAALLTVNWPHVIDRASLTRAVTDAMRGVAERLARRA